MMRSALLLLAAVAASAAAQAQAQAQAQADAQAHTSPYAGEQTREIKALSERDMADLLAGRGMGYAKAAELNGYPGPAHVLELAEALQLTQEQRESTRRLMERHQVAARELGARLVDAERALDRAFATRQVDEASLQRLTGEIGRLQAQLRAEHLRTHLEQTKLLTQQQATRYGELRGYAAGAPSGHHGHHHR